jgi:hypothetical protein
MLVLLHTEQHSTLASLAVVNDEQQPVVSHKKFYYNRALACGIRFALNRRCS